MSGRRLATLLVASQIGCATASEGDELSPASVKTTNPLPGALLVDDDGAQCPDAAFATIQGALDAAEPGVIVEVCPGVYEGDVVVEKDVALVGPQRGVDARGRDLADAEEAVLTGTVFVEASGVEVIGFLARRDPVLGNLQAEDAMVLRAGTSGHAIRDTRFELDPADSGTTGILVASDGLATVAIERNAFSALDDGAWAVGTSVDAEGAASNLRIANNTFAEAGIYLYESGADTTIADNVMDAVATDATFLSIVGTNDVAVERNRVRTRDVGIRVRDADGIVIAGNEVSEGTDCIRVLSDGTFGTVDVQVLENRANACDRGIVVLRAEGATVRDNHVAGGGDGIVLDEATWARVEGNLVEANDVGLRATATSFDNALVANRARDNALDCRDDSTGGFTAGTANLWVGNEGDTSSPEGLCAASP